MLDMYRLLWILNDTTEVAPEVTSARASVVSGGTLTYSRDDLLQLRSSILCKVGPVDPIPPELRSRRRGRRGGVRTRLRKRRFKPHLPSIILANVRSLKPKMDVLHASCRLKRAGSSQARRYIHLDRARPRSEIKLSLSAAMALGKKLSLYLLVPVLSAL